MNMNAARICPICGKPAVPDAPQGLCPECLMKSGFDTQGPEQAGGGKSGFVPPSVEQVARLFPQLEVLELLGQGGMGAVYKARQPALNRFVVLKILPPQSAQDPGFAERFNREARALARLNHPNIVAVRSRLNSPRATSETPCVVRYIVLGFARANPTPCNRDAPLVPSPKRRSADLMNRTPLAVRNCLTPTWHTW